MLTASHQWRGNNIRFKQWVDTFPLIILTFLVVTLRGYLSTSYRFYPGISQVSFTFSWVSKASVSGHLLTMTIGDCHCDRVLHHYISSVVYFSKSIALTLIQKNTKNNIEGIPCFCWTQAGSHGKDYSSKPVAQIVQKSHYSAVIHQILSEKRETFALIRAAMRNFLVFGAFLFQRKKIC